MRAVLYNIQRKGVSLTVSVGGLQKFLEFSRYQRKHYFAGIISVINGESTNSLYGETYFRDI
jgi:hypothetical protein